MKKRLISLFLAFCMCYCIIPAANAVDENAKMTIFADEIISRSQMIDLSGTQVVHYDFIDEFIAKIKSAYPEISDYEIGKFVLHYTGQFNDSLTEQDILDAVTFQDITITRQIFTVDEKGNAQMRTSLPMQMGQISPNEQEIVDEDISITTAYSKIGTDGDENIYNISAVAEWINFPAVCIQDAFALRTTGTFDSDYTERASVSQNFLCSNCGRTTYYQRNVNANDTEDQDATLRYTSDGIPYVDFAPVSPFCQYCMVSPAEDSLFTVSIRYWMRADESVEIQAGYGHTISCLLPSYISVSLGPSGLGISFSMRSAEIKSYIARPITVNYE